MAKIVVRDMSKKSCMRVVKPQMKSNMKSMGKMGKSKKA